MPIIDLKQSLPRPLKRPQTTHKLQKIVSMNAGISETIKDRELGFKMHAAPVCYANVPRPQATQKKKFANAPLAPTNRPNMFATTFFAKRREQSS